MESLFDISVLNECLSTLDKCSYDSENKVFMTKDSRSAVNFDKAKAVHVQSLGLAVDSYPNSNDALICKTDGKYVFIEFKNGRIIRNKGNGATAKAEIQYKLMEKCYDSVLLLSDIIKKDISWMRENIEYVLVYNEQKNAFSPSDPDSVEPSLKVISDNVFAQAGMEKVLFGIGKFRKFIFNDVHTYTEKEFEDFLHRISDGL